MAHQFPNDDEFDAGAVETEPMETRTPDAADGAFDETLGDGGAITDPLLVGASGPDGAGTGMGGPMDGPVDGPSPDRESSTGDGSTDDGATDDDATVDGSIGDGSIGDGSIGDGSTGGGSTGDGFAGEDVASEDVQSSLRSTAPDQERSAAADSPDATIPTASGDDIPSGDRDGGGS